MLVASSSVNPELSRLTSPSIVRLNPNESTVVYVTAAVGAGVAASGVMATVGIAVGMKLVPLLVPLLDLV